MDGHPNAPRFTRRARGDFEQIVAKHFKATEWRERLKAWPAEDLDAAEQFWSDALARKGIVMARNRASKTLCPKTICKDGPMSGRYHRAPCDNAYSVQRWPNVYLSSRSLIALNAIPENAQITAKGGCQR
jgi:hypothetical protein